MPGSGGKRMQINTRERAVSTDINRAQKFLSAQGADVARWLYDATSTDASAGDNSTVGVGGETPLRAVIYNGLLPVPQNGLTDLLILPGAGLFVAPDAVPSSDDSVCKEIVDPGVPTLGVLVLSPNSAGSTRVDVVECSIVDQVLETDNRDIFDPSSGLFTAATVDKVAASRLTYRIRQGTAGAGFPGLVQGWLPLTVCLVANGTTTWDTVTMFDVRPLLADRAKAPFAQQKLKARHRCEITTDLSQYPGKTLIQGLVETEATIGLGTILAGGFLATGDLEAGIDVKNSARYKDPGASFGAGALWYLYAVFPFGLPRWCRYAGTGTRRPVGMRGIPVVTNIVPTLDGGASAGVNLPTFYGLAAPAADGALLIAGMVTAASAANFGPMVSVGNEQVLEMPYGGGRVLTASPASTGDQSQFTLTPGVDYPANALSVRVRLEMHLKYTGASGISSRFNVGDVLQSNAGLGMNIGKSSPMQNTVPDVGTTEFFITETVDVIPSGDGAPISITWNYNANTNVAGGGNDYHPSNTHPDGKLDILGWTLGQVT